MTSRNHWLPPLNALRVFWVVMQQRSFKAAADELLVSPQAVSQQIHLLEHVLGVSLFDRRSRLIEPTAQARMLAPFISAGFDEFIEGVSRVSTSTNRDRININVSPYFAARYLMDKLHRFCEMEPTANIQVTNMIRTPNFSTDEVDLSIQWGFGDWPNYDAALLVKDPKVICCAPSLADQVKEPRDLQHVPLLYPPIYARNMWDDILSHLGINEHDAANKLQFQDAESMRAGTISGLGVGLISLLVATRDLREGRLMAPLGIDAIADLPEECVPGFYVIVPHSHKRVRLVLSFYDWVTSQQWDPLQTQALRSFSQGVDGPEVPEIW